ncbi:MAG: hypothetical protein WCO06_01735 [Candidatus Roizmanbacteria bacterium]
MLEHIITSKARRKILELFFHHPNESYYLRHVVREVKQEVNAVKRELDIMIEGKVLLKERRLNKVFYTLNKSYVFYDDFLRIFAKQTELANSIFKALPKIGKVKFIVLSTKYVKKILVKEDEIYLLLVGAIVVPEIAPIVNQAEVDFGREVNYTVMSDEEFAFRKKNNDPFIWRFLKQPKIMIVGSEEELLK